MTRWMRAGAAVAGGEGTPRVVYVLSLIAAALLLTTSVAGLLAGERGLYDPDPRTLPAFYAQDAMGLLLALPLLLTSMWLTRRGSLRGLLLWSGALFYIVYWYYFYVVGARFNPLYLAYVALVSTSLFALVGLVARMSPGAIRDRFAPGAPTRVIGGYLVAMALLFAGLWVTDVIAHLRRGEPLDAVSRHVYAIDLTLLLPTMAVVGAWVWRRRPWGYALAGILLVKAASSGLMLLAGTAMQARWGVPVDPAQLLGYGLLTAGGVALVIVYLSAVRGDAAALSPTRGLSSPTATGSAAARV